jgi:general L-amino acid transport system permease protein
MTDAAQPPLVNPPRAKEVRVAFYNNPTIRGWVYQALTIIVIAYLVYAAYRNATEAAGELGIFTGFRLWDAEAGFAIGFSLLSFSESDSIFAAFVVGLANTLLVAVLGIVLATIIGFLVGLARLSPNWLLSKVAYWYVEIFRNTPLLLILVFFYSFKNWLPELGEVAENPWGVYATVKGLYAPKPVFGEGSFYVLILLLAGIAGSIAIRFWAKARRERTAGPRSG